jgi:hypothetical protein
MGGAALATTRSALAASARMNECFMRSLEGEAVLEDRRSYGTPG